MRITEFSSHMCGFGVCEQSLKEISEVLARMADGKLAIELKYAYVGEFQKVKEALKGTDTEAIKAATESLTKVFYEISAKMYQQANPEAGMDPNMGANEAQGEVVDDE